MCMYVILKIGQFKTWQCLVWSKLVSYQFIVHWLEVKCSNLHLKYIFYYRSSLHFGRKIREKLLWNHLWQLRNIVPWALVVEISCWNTLEKKVQVPVVHSSYLFFFIFLFPFPILSSFSFADILFMPKLASSCISFIFSGYFPDLVGT